MSSGAARHDRERRRGLAPELLADGRQVGRAELAVGRSGDGAHRMLILAGPAPGTDAIPMRDILTPHAGRPRVHRASHGPARHPPVPPRGRRRVRRVSLGPGRGSLPELGRLHARTRPSRSSRRWRRSIPGMPGEWFQFAVADPSTDALARRRGAPRGRRRSVARGARVHVVARPSGEGIRDRSGHAPRSTTRSNGWGSRRGRRSPTHATNRRSRCWNGSGCDARVERSTCSSRASGATNTPMSCGVRWR